MENQKQSNGLTNELITDLKRVLKVHNERTNEYVKSVKDTILSEIAIYGSVQNKNINLVLNAARNTACSLQNLIDKLQTL